MIFYDHRCCAEGAPHTRSRVRRPAEATCKFLFDIRLSAGAI